MFKKRHKKGASGAVMVEFALAFPILLITFIFAIQLLFVFIYDILGSYAAYAAARSYSVFCPQIGEVEAGKLAKGVAAAIMYSWTIPGAGEDTINEPPPAGVEQFFGMMSHVGLCTTTGSDNDTGTKKTALNEDELARYQTVLYRMKDFKVELEETGICMVEGFSYNEKSDGENDGTPKSGGVERQRPGAWNALMHFFGIGGDKTLYQAKVGRVSFHYDYSASMMFSRFSYLGSKASSSDQPAIFSIYQTCAMPIEPKWDIKPGKGKAAAKGFYAANYEQLMLDVNEEITNKLNAVYFFTETKMGMVGSTDYVQSFREFITGSRTDDRSDRNRQFVNTWQQIDGISGTYNGEFVDWQYVPASDSAVPDPLLVERDMSAQPNADLVTQPVIDVLETLKRETAYRDLVIRNINREIAQAGQELNDLQAIRDAERVITAALNTIDILEGYLSGKSGWYPRFSAGTQNFSSSQSAPNLYFIRSYRPVVGRTKEGRPIYGATRYVYAVRDDAAIRRAITDQQNIIAAAEARIAAAQGRINNFLKQEEIDFIRKDDTYNDNTVTNAQRKIDGIVAVWVNRRTCESSVLIEEDKAVRVRFVDLMNTALVPIADYYRIQKQLMEDQKLGLSEAKETSDALKNTGDEK